MKQLTLKIERIDEAYQQAIKDSTTLENLELVRIQFLGRKGEQNKDYKELSEMDNAKIPKEIKDN
jgi:predicted nuclease of restriction endonuclease-like (RecB) superfamily